MPRPAEEARDDAVREQKRVSALVSAAIEDIHAAYRESVAAYPSIAALEAEIGGGGAARPAPGPAAGERVARLAERGRSG